jgi:hypothetical protein
MTDPFRDSIIESMNTKETEELVKIWQEHDPEEWTETAYEVIAEILQERLGEVPPITGVVEENGDEEENEESEDDNPPVFYDPSKVLTLTKWINYAIYLGIASAALSKINQFDYYHDLVGSYFLYQPNTGFLVIILTIIALVIDLGLTCVLIYFPFKALRYILQMLMEMEFNSR